MMSPAPARLARAGRQDGITRSRVAHRPTRPARAEAQRHPRGVAAAGRRVVAACGGRRRHVATAPGMGAAGATTAGPRAVMTSAPLPSKTPDHDPHNTLIVGRARPVTCGSRRWLDSARHSRSIPRAARRSTSTRSRTRLAEELATTLNSGWAQASRGPANSRGAVPARAGAPLPCRRYPAPAPCRGPGGSTTRAALEARSA